MNYELSALIDIPQLQKLLDSFYNATGIPSGIVARDGTILTATGWRDICTKFHRVNPKSQLRCVESDKYILDQFQQGNTVVNFKCKNGLIDLGTPIIVEGTFLATIFIGQILFEEPNIEYFKKQAAEFGFNEEEYLNALKKIPVVDKEEHEKVLCFLQDFAQMISEMGLRQLKLLEAQKKLELSEERYKLAIYGSNDGMWDWNFVDKDFYASNRFLEILGYTAEEVNSLFTCCKKLIHPDDRDYCVQKFHQHLKSETSHFSEEVRIKTKWDTYKWVLIRGSAIWSNEGIPIRMAGSLTDLSNQKSSEELLKKERYFSETIINHANIIICVWSPDGSLLQFNRYAQKFSGYSEKEVLGYNWMNTACPDELGETTLKFIRSFKSDITTQKEGPFYCKNGSVLDILWSNQILKNEDDSIKNIITMGLDITKRINEEKRLSEFFSNISHELRTPLNIIFSSLQLMDFYISNNSLYDNIDKFINYKKSMKQNCYRLLRLVNNLIDITKIDSGYLMLDLEKCNIISLVEDIILSISEYVENKNLTLTFDTNVEEKMLCCYPDKIERIILNLLSNAIKFTNPGDSILVSMEDKGQSIIISIKDTGIGIEQDKLDVIFERFKQVNKSFSREHEGSGIGLSLVKSLVEMHNGTIEAKSSYGKGSEFIIELPINESNCKNTPTSLNELYNEDHSKIEKVNVEFADIYFT